MGGCVSTTDIYQIKIQVFKSARPNSRATVSRLALIIITLLAFSKLCFNFGQKGNRLIVIGPVIVKLISSVLGNESFSGSIYVSIQKYWHEAGISQ